MTRDHTGRCCQRTPGDTPSWIRPHVCRLNPDHHGPHQCTCTYEWNTHRDAA